MDEWMDGRKDRRMDGWMIGRKKGIKDRRI